MSRPPTAPALSWFRGHSPAELIAALKPRGLTVRDITPGRLVFAEGVEAWGAGTSWLVGAPADLRRACDGAAVQVLSRNPSP